MNSPFIFRFSSLTDFLNGDRPTCDGEIVYLKDTGEMYCRVNGELRKVQYVYTGDASSPPTRYDPNEYVLSLQNRSNSSSSYIGYLISENPILMDDLPEIDNERLGELL